MPISAGSTPQSSKIGSTVLGSPAPMRSDMSRRSTRQAACSSVMPHPSASDGSIESFCCRILDGWSRARLGDRVGIVDATAALAEYDASPNRVLESWLLLLAEADLALKGSRRSGQAVLGTMLVDMCTR